MQQTACDTTPNAFSFTDVTGAEVSTLTTSNSITIGGINTSTPVSVSGSGSPQIRINGGSWVTSGTITNGQSLQVRLTSSASNDTASTATVNVGGVTDSWSVTTESGAQPQTNYETTETDSTDPCTVVSYVVPAGVTKVLAQLWGGSGGNMGGNGGYTQAYLNVTPGETLTLITGQSGIFGFTNYNNWSVSACGGGGRSYGAAGGGGRSAVRRGSTELLTAGGGGAGGSAYVTARGGHGGGLSGQDGWERSSCPSSKGFGGTQSAGGAGGTGDKPGQAGSAFKGGDGGGFVGHSGSGGGGGGGYFGGGGASYAQNSSCTGADGGGGGSSYCGGGSHCVTIEGYGASQTYDPDLGLTNGLVLVTPVNSTPAPVVFDATGADQTYTVPSGVSTLLVGLWGAGSLSYTAGGYTQGYLSVTPGETIKVMVGQAPTLTNCTATYGGGGYSANKRGCGAGRSAVFKGATELMTAGGAGGGGRGVGGAGGGSGTDGGDCTLSASIPGKSGGHGGGAGFCKVSGTAASGANGGNGGGSKSIGGGGGGGFPHGGGGGGGSNTSTNAKYSTGGGGGMGYCGGAGVSNCITLNGMGAPGGKGANDVVTLPGGDGKVVIIPFSG